MAEVPRILVADDSPTSLVWEKLILREESYEIVAAKDGHQALKLALEKRPHLIILDVVMPGMSGLEVCQELRRSSAPRSIPIIGVSERTEQADIDAARRAGCDDFLKKPVDKDQLLDVVSRRLRRARLSTD